MATYIIVDTAITRWKVMAFCAITFPTSILAQDILQISYV